jgi:hypothetical protein
MDAKAKMKQTKPPDPIVVWERCTSSVLQCPRCEGFWVAEEFGLAPCPWCHPEKAKAA